MADETPRGPGRPPRAQQERKERRRRGDSTLAAAKRLPIPPEVAEWAKRENRHLRWANDEGNRMHQLTVQDDYDPVPFDVKPVPIAVGPDGQAIKAHLLSKPLEYFQEDQAKQQRKIKETEDALFKRPEAADAAGKDRNPNPGTAERYLDKSTSINRSQNQILGD